MRTWIVAYKEAEQYGPDPLIFKIFTGFTVNLKKKYYVKQNWD